MLLPAKYLIFTLIFLQGYANINSFTLSKTENIENMLEKILSEKSSKYVTPTTEDEAWEFFGIPRCTTGEGRQCFPGTSSDQCFNGIQDTCNGVVDCNCQAGEFGEEVCAYPNDESPEACQLKDQVTWIMENSLPNFGYGQHDSEVFSVLWFMGITDYCPARTTGYVSTITCPEDPNMCITVDQFCDGTEHCPSLCYNIQGYKFYGTNDWLGGCLIKDTVNTVEQGYSRKRRDVLEARKTILL